MKTICYVDGYNLYFGCLKHTPYKWLDLFKLFNQILNAQDPSFEVVGIKYFTSPIITKLATQGQLAQQSQQAYHRALETLYPEVVTIINGYYSMDKAHAVVYKSPPDKTDRVDVWKLEEKQTDVAMALTAYRDAQKGNAEQLVFVSNDTDLEPALKAVRDDFGAQIRIGVVLPIRELPQGSVRRPGNNRLSVLADWTRSVIKNHELASSQFPVTIPTRKKPIRKPVYW